MNRGGGGRGGGGSCLAVGYTHTHTITTKQNQVARRLAEVPLDEQEEATWEQVCC